MFSSIAREALAKALEVYEGLAKLTASLDQINSRFVDFRDEARKRLDSHEHRIEGKLVAVENRNNSKDALLEARMRELECRFANLEGRTAGALAEAYKTLLTKSTGIDISIKNAPTDARLGDGTVPPFNGAVTKDP